MQSAGRRRSAPEHGCELPRSVRSESGSLKFNDGDNRATALVSAIRVHVPPSLRFIALLSRNLCVYFAFGNDVNDACDSARTPFSWATILMQCSE